jgi:cytochrome b
MPPSMHRPLIKSIMPKPVSSNRRTIKGPGAHGSHATVRVWDAFIRTFHWSLVLSFAVAWVTAHSAERIHHWAGYVAASLILGRIVWGVLGTPYARFSQFVRHPTTSARYLLDIVAGREVRFIGHNPAGGMMIIALMMAIVSSALTGWMMTTEAWFGVDWVETAHSISVHALLFLIFLHVAGVALASLRHRENLVRAMITGRKRKPGVQDVA